MQLYPRIIIWSGRFGTSVCATYLASGTGRLAGPSHDTREVLNQVKLVLYFTLCVISIELNLLSWIVMRIFIWILPSALTSCTSHIMRTRTHTLTTVSDNHGYMHCRVYLLSFVGLSPNINLSILILNKYLRSDCWLYFVVSLDRCLNYFLFFFFHFYVNSTKFIKVTL